ncbi:MAG: biopolymer transporter ExbD [Myxococcaceae bacterium]|nr:biopolymer transporter ExbD [Myxococcaceae bacterium]
MIKIPGKRYGKRLSKSKVFGEGGHAKKSTFADLLITPMVDMFVIIVLFLIANFSATGEILMMTKDIQLPEAKNVQEVQMVPVVMVSNEEVVVDGASVVRLADIEGAEYLNIPQLEEKLRELKKKTEDLHSMAGDTEGFKGDINIQGHKEVPFKYIKKIMFSCTTAGYGNINFAVLNKGGGGKPEETTAAAGPAE